MIRNGVLLAVSIALIGLAWLVGPTPAGPPLYDGLGFPDEPYRYIDPPPDAQPTPPATAAKDQKPVINGTQKLLYATSAEEGPQVELQIATGALKVPATATTVSVRARPVAPKTPPPKGTIWGNVYRLTATSNTGPVQMSDSPSATTTIKLRAPYGPEPVPVIHINDGSGWRALPTSRAGNDIYAAPITKLADYAVVKMPAGYGEGDDSNTLEIAVLGGSFIVIIGVAMLVRLTRPRREVAPEGPSLPVAGVINVADRVRQIAPTLDVPHPERARLGRLATTLRAAANADNPDRDTLLGALDDLLACLRDAPGNAAVNNTLTLGGLTRQELSNS